MKRRQNKANKIIAQHARRSKNMGSLKGNAPGSVVFLGDSEKKAGEITCIMFNPEKVEINTHIKIEDIPDIHPENSCYWYNLDGLTDTKRIEILGKKFGIHTLILEDIVNTEQRPKSERVETKTFTTVKMLWYVNNSLLKEQISFVLDKNVLVSFQEEPGDIFNSVRSRLEDPNRRTRTYGADYLLFALLDVVVDHYFIVLDTLNEEAELLEERMLSNPRKEILGEIQSMRRKLLEIRRAAYPLRESIQLLENDDVNITEINKKYYRDLLDHIYHVNEMCDNLREMNTSLRDSYNTILNNRMNEVMKTLTIISTIFIPLTFIAGVYGMNFKNMPEIEMENAYFVTLAGMGLLALILIGFFRFKKWL
jgi:magnesium transporter